MREYEKLSEEFIESKMVDPVFAVSMKISWQIGFLKARAIAEQVLMETDVSRAEDIQLIRSLGEKEV